MARINTNVPAVVAQRTLRQTQRDLRTSLERLSSGLRINRGSDDPAGLINSEMLRAEISGVEKAISNSQRAINIIATTEGALNEASNLLTDIQGLIVEIANDAAMSPDEKAANQLQIDSAIESITRIANSTTFAGRTLLNGDLAYVTSGVRASAIATLAVNSVQFGSASFIPVDVAVTTSAQKAMLTFGNGTLTSSISIEVRGSMGTAVIEFSSGTGAQDVVDAVNRQVMATGIEARLVSATDPTQGMVFQSVGYGSHEFVEITMLPGSGSFDLTGDGGAVYTDSFKRDTGRDAVAMINGAASIGRGLDLSLNTRTLALELTLNENFGIGSTTFAITGGGAMFQLGPQVSPNQQVNIGVQSIASSRLGNANLGFLSQIKKGGDYEVMRNVDNAAQASMIVDEAINQVAVLRGRLGSFERNTLVTNINSLTITMENLISSESAIRDTDFAYETARLTRAQILTQAGTSVLAIANTTPQSVLSLLG